jgi:PPM family protein phosphatase
MGGHLAGGTRAGLTRKQNEDTGYAGRWLCAVADGMGGHVCGEVASAAAIEAVRQFDVEVDGPQELVGMLSRAVSAASKLLAARIESDSALAGMGTTLTALLWAGSHVAVANVGDSRAYLLRHGRLVQITEDHVLSKLVAHPMPSRTGAFLVRYLDGRLDRSPDLTLRAVQPGDRYLICSDGLTGVLDSEAIRQGLDTAEEPDQAVAELIRLAREAGAPDDVTVIVADAPDGTWQPASSSAVVGVIGPGPGG